MATSVGWRLFFFFLACSIWIRIERQFGIHSGALRPGGAFKNYYVFFERVKRAANWPEAFLVLFANFPHFVYLESSHNLNTILVHVNYTPAAGSRNENVNVRALLTYSDLRVSLHRTSRTQSLHIFEYFRPLAPTSQHFIAQTNFIRGNFI